jgi:hypothetical protein
MSITKPLGNTEESAFINEEQKPEEVASRRKPFIFRASPSYEKDSIYHNRSYETYLRMLFPDEEDNEKRGAVKAVSINQGEIVTTYTPLVQAHSLCGGRREFFREGSQILDVGSGGGNALMRMNELYASRGVRVLGIDAAYTDFIPEGLNSKTAVAGNWLDMPFEDNSFDGLLSCESNLKWLGKTGNNVFFTEDDIQVIDEVTRVAREGAVWRATFSGLNKLPENKLFIQNMTERGWKVFFFDGTMVARLEKKN